MGDTSRQVSKVLRCTLKEDEAAAQMDPPITFLQELTQVLSRSSLEEARGGMQRDAHKHWPDAHIIDASSDLHGPHCREAQAAGLDAGVMHHHASLPGAC
jgi:hypothetical protein